MRAAGRQTAFGLVILFAQAAAVVLADVVDGKDVGVVHLGGGLRLAAEALDLILDGLVARFFMIEGEEIHDFKDVSNLEEAVGFL